MIREIMAFGVGVSTGIGAVAVVAVGIMGLILFDDGDDDGGQRVDVDDDNVLSMDKARKYADEQQAKQAAT